MSNLDSILKSRDITLPTKVHLVKAMMFPVVMKVCESWTIKKATAAKSRQSCPTLCDPIDGSPPGSCPWDSLGKNTRGGCHFLLQCMKVKSESEGAQLCLTLRNSMDCSSLGSSIHGIFQARVLEWDAIAFSKMWSYLLYIQLQFFLYSSTIYFAVLLHTNTLFFCYCHFLHLHQ